MPQAGEGGLIQWVAPGSYVRPSAGMRRLRLMKNVEAAAGHMAWESFQQAKRAEMLHSALTATAELVPSAGSSDAPADGYTSGAHWAAQVQPTPR